MQHGKDEALEVTARVPHETDCRGGDTDQSPLAIVCVHARAEVLGQHRNDRRDHGDVVSLIQGSYKLFDFERGILPLLVRSVAEGALDKRGEGGLNRD